MTINVLQKIQITGGKVSSSILQLSYPQSCLYGLALIGVLLVKQVSSQVDEEGHQTLE